MFPLSRYESVLEFMVKGEQNVRYIPTAVIPSDERLLRARLVLEEAVEFVEAMGCRVVWDYMGKPVVADWQGGVNLVAAADALADITVVVEGSAITMGIPLDRVFDVVMKSNMEKFVDGKPYKDEGGKVTKPPGWKKPDVAKVLRVFGWKGHGK